MLISLSMNTILAFRTSYDSKPTCIEVEGGSEYAPEVPK